MDNRDVRHEVREKLSHARSMLPQRPGEALRLAREAYSLADYCDDQDVRIDAAVYLIARLSHPSLRAERTALVNEWEPVVMENGSANQKGGLLNSIAVSHLESGESPRALETLKRSGDCYDRIDDPRIRAILQINYGNAYTAVGMHDMAVKAFERALVDVELIDDRGLRKSIHTNLGIVFRKLLDNDEALKQFEIVREMAEEDDDVMMLASSFTNLCTVYYFKEDFDSALECALLSHKYNTRLDNSHGMLASLTNLGMLYYRTDQLDQAIHYFELSMSIAQSLGHTFAIANLIKNFGDIHMARRRIDQAEEHSMKAWGMAVEIEAVDLQNDVKAALVRVYEEREDWKKALEGYKELMDLKTRFFLGRQREIVEDFRLRYDMESKERESQFQRERNQVLQNEIEERKIAEMRLKEALDRIKVMSGLLPICSHCKKIRDKDGSWYILEQYITEHSDAQLTHSFCPECMQTYYGEGVILSPRPGKSRKISPIVDSTIASTQE